MDQSRLIDLAFDFCMRAEGNATYTDDPDDAGGPTKFGLALNYNRDVLPDKNGDGYINAADVRLLEREDARQVWERVYWRGNGCHLLPDDPATNCSQYAAAATGIKYFSYGHPAMERFSPWRKR